MPTIKDEKKVELIPSKEENDDIFYDIDINEGEYLFQSIEDLIAIYFTLKRLPATTASEIKRDYDYYLNEILKLLKNFNIIE